MVTPSSDYVWPRTLHQPVRPPKLIYLDVNHWIALAKANTGRPDGEPFREALTACLDAAERRTAVFPISDSSTSRSTRSASLASATISVK